MPRRYIRLRRSLAWSPRWGLVGIECLEPRKRLRGGSILFTCTDRIEGHGCGDITSVTWSTVLEKFITLGLDQGGLGHTGEEIVCAFPVKGDQTRARIVSPVFIDPRGEHLRV
jgi:sarcosine oxidase subunit alpha